MEEKTKKKNQEKTRSYFGFKSNYKEVVEIQYKINFCVYPYLTHLITLLLYTNTDHITSIRKENTDALFLLK